MDKLDTLVKTIDENKSKINKYMKIFYEIHPNVHLIFADKPSGFSLCITHAYRNGVIFTCLENNQLRNYFYYEYELDFKIKSKKQRWSEIPEQLRDIQFQF